MTPPGGGPHPAVSSRMVLPFPTTGQPGFSFPSPSTILGSGPTPSPALGQNVRAQGRDVGRREHRGIARRNLAPRGAVRAPRWGPAARTRRVRAASRRLRRAADRRFGSIGGRGSATMSGRSATADRAPRRLDGCRSRSRGIEIPRRTPMPEPTETDRLRRPAPRAADVGLSRSRLQRYDQRATARDPPALRRCRRGRQRNHKVRPDWIVDRLAEPRTAERLLGGLAVPSRTAMGAVHAHRVARLDLRRA